MAKLDVQRRYTSLEKEEKYRGESTPYFLHVLCPQSLVALSRALSSLAYKETNLPSKFP